MKKFDYSLNPNASPEGFDSYGVSSRWSFVPEEWRRTFAQKYAGVMSPATYFDIRASFARLLHKDEIINEFSREDGGSLDPNHLPLFDSRGDWPYGTTQGEGTQIQRDNVDEFIASTGGSDQTFQANYLGGNSIIFGRFLSPNGRLYASSNGATPEILSGMALQTFITGARPTAERLVKNGFATYDWIRKGLGIKPVIAAPAAASASSPKAPPAKPAPASGTNILKGVSKSSLGAAAAQLSLATPTTGAPTGEGLVQLQAQQAAANLPSTQTTTPVQVQTTQSLQVQYDADGNITATSADGINWIPTQTRYNASGSPTARSFDNGQTWTPVVVYQPAPASPTPQVVYQPAPTPTFDAATELATFTTRALEAASGYLKVPSFVVFFTQNPNLEKYFFAMVKANQDSFRAFWNRTYPPKMTFSK